MFKKRFMVRGQRVDNEEWVTGLLVVNSLGTKIFCDDNPHECGIDHYIEIDDYYPVYPESVEPVAIEMEKYDPETDTGLCPICKTVTGILSGTPTHCKYCGLRLAREGEGQCKS